MFATPAFEAKICSPGELVQRVAALARPLVFTNGVFDILHRGHVTYLAQARALGASLVLALNADASVKRLNKGADRPINMLADRMAVAASLEMIDIVTYFEDDTPLNLILACRPDILVKGGDWPVEQIVGAPEVTGWGGKIYSIPFLHERSTTAMLKKIRA
jgi:D-glycero-beta-D-manno-heptose 1-phosphate adenylyltransferase